MLINYINIYIYFKIIEIILISHKMVILKLKNNFKIIIIIYIIKPSNYPPFPSKLNILITKKINKFNQNINKFQYMIK